MIKISDAFVSSQIKRILVHMSDISSIAYISIDKKRLLFISVDHLDAYSMEFEIPFIYFTINNVINKQLFTVNITNLTYIMKNKSVVNVLISKTDNVTNMNFNCKEGPCTKNYTFEMENANVNIINYLGFKPVKPLFDLKFRMIQFTEVILQLRVYNLFLEMSTYNENLSFSIDSKINNKCAYVYENVVLFKSDVKFKYIMKYFIHICNLSEYDTLQIMLYDNGLISISLTSKNNLIIPICTRITNITLES